MPVPGNNITYLAKSDFRGKNIKFGIKQEDRTKHMYVIGKTGMGKSTLLENMAVQDIQSGHGLSFIDPHGETAELLLDYVPEDRKQDVLYFAPFDLEHPISFNVMEDVEPDRRPLVANGLMSAFKKIWVDMWSARMEYILNNVLLALLEYPDATILGVNRMLADKTYRKRVVANVQDVSVKSFWEDEFAKYGDRYMQEAGASIQNKIGQFISNPLVRNIIGQPQSSFDVRKLMDEKKIVIVNLSKGRVGEDNANLIGSMLITKLYLGAMSRADVTPQERKGLPNFYFYVDEFQSFANESFSDILSEARKYKLNLTIAHQYIEQMTDEVRAAVFGNVGTLVTFRVGAHDADYLEKEFAPEFEAQDLVNLGFTQIYLRLMIDGVSSRPFSATTLPPIDPPDVSHRDEVIAASRARYAKTRAEVEEEIIAWHQDSGGIVNPETRERLKQEAIARRKAQDSNNKGGKQHTSGSSGKSHNKKRSHSSQSKKKGGGDKKRDKKGEKERAERLNNAISLKQLNQDNKPPQKKKKPSKSHLSELRDALASVIGESEVREKEEADKKKEEDEKKEKEGKDGQDNKQGEEEGKQEDSKQEDAKNKKENDDKKEDSENSSAKSGKASGDTQASEDKKKEQHEKTSSSAPGEIPEDELKKMLSVDE